MLPYTRDVVFLEEGDLAHLRRDGVTIYNQGAPVERASQRINWSPAAAQRVATNTSCSKRSSSSRAPSAIR